MPLYEYKCKKCKARLEVMQKISDRPREKCPQCGGPLEKILSPSALQFKGSGFYITDYVKKEKPAKEDVRKEPKEKQTAFKSDSPPSSD
ncbi:MAG: FmdB family zinc ribbon protein [Candidatus Aminicenantales bacterium]